MKKKYKDKAFFSTPTKYQNISETGNLVFCKDLMQGDTSKMHKQMQLDEATWCLVSLTRCNIYAAFNGNWLLLQVIYPCPGKVYSNKIITF